MDDPSGFSASCEDQADCDVFIAGGGTAGVVAAIQAGRLGARTIIAEASSQMGGAATTGGVNSPILFDVHGKQKIRGIGWEWVENTIKLDDGAAPESSPHWRINAPLFAIVAEEMLLRAGVSIRYHEAPLQVEPREDGSFHWLVHTAAMGAVRRIRARQLVDCTGNGSLCALAGAERMREAESMPGSIQYALTHRLDPNRLDPAEIERKFAEAITRGEMLASDARHGMMTALSYQSGNYVVDADNASAAARSDTNIRGRQSVLRMLRFLRSLPGGETAQLASLSPEVGVRETFRVRGECVITVDDYLSGRTWDDSIAFATYQVDMHKNAWDDFDRRHLAPGVFPTVPFRALVPLGMKHLLVAGRCLSSDRLAFSALRVQAVCMATGQAAGAAAAIASSRDATPGDIPTMELKAVLTANGAIVP